MSEEEKDLIDFLYRLIEQGTHKIYDDDLHDRKICEYINLIENQQEEIEKQAKEIEELKAQKQIINNKRKELDNKLNDYKEGKFISLKVNKLYISKQKIKDKIEEISKDKKFVGKLGNGKFIRREVKSKEKVTL